MKNLSKYWEIWDRFKIIDTIIYRNIFNNGRM